MPSTDQRLAALAIEVADLKIRELELIAAVTAYRQKEAAAATLPAKKATAKKTASPRT